MFKVGDKYKLVDPDGAMMTRTPEGTILEVVGFDEQEDALVKGCHVDDADFISENDVEKGYVVKTASGDELSVREILCSAAEQVYEKTGIRLEEVDFHWLDQGDGPYIHSIHIEGGA